MSKKDGRTSQFKAAIAGTLFAMSDGMSVGWTSPMIPYLISPESHIKTTKYEAEWLESALLAGAFCGLPTTMYSVDKFGRKKSILFASVAMLIEWGLILFGNKMAYLFVARFLAGMAGNMAFVAGPMYMAEIADQKIRGLLSGIILIMLHSGTLLIYCIGPFTPFCVTPLIGSLIAVTELAVFYFMPESPVYLVEKNKEEEAREALCIFKPYGNVDEEVKEITRMLEKENSNRGRLQDLILEKNNRKALTIMTVLNVGQHLTASTVIVMNFHLILELAGSIYMDTSYAAILFAGIMLAACILSSVQVDKFGRKILLIVSSLGSGLCVLLLAVYFHLKYLDVDVAAVSWIPIASVMAYSCFFNLGFGSVSIILTAELFSTNIKAIGMTVADGTFIIGGLVSIQIYQILSEAFHIFVPFYIFSVAAFLIACYTFFFIPETKGKSLEEIQEILKGK